MLNKETIEQLFEEQSLPVFALYKYKLPEGSDKLEVESLSFNRDLDELLTNIPTPEVPETFIDDGAMDYYRLKYGATPGNMEEQAKLYFTTSPVNFNEMYPDYELYGVQYTIALICTPDTEKTANYIKERLIEAAGGGPIPLPLLDQIWERFLERIRFYPFSNNEQHADLQGEIVEKYQAYLEDLPMDV